MDRYQAQQLERQLKGESFHGLTIETLLNNGKSAAVFKATDNQNKPVALKIFDNDFLKRFGFDVQQKRIDQEISLKGHGISGLIEIINGGYGEIAGTDYFFIIMAYVDGQNIKEYIQDQTYNSLFIKKVAKTLFEVSQQLLERGIVHRDIKPENIMVSSTGEIILMDLGVIKLIGAPSFSDADQKQFVGTLQYAPPEFLLREEEDTPQAWKAINLYQIGAVLHDLIIKKELFDGISPFSRLVLAIKEDAPEISTTEYSFEAVQLIRDLLSKVPQQRLLLVSDIRLTTWFETPDKAENDFNKQLETIRKITSLHKITNLEIDQIQRSNKEKKAIRDGIGKQLQGLISQCMERLVKQDIFKEHKASPPFIFDSDRELANQFSVGNYLYELKGSLDDGFSAPLYIFFKTQNDEQSNASISLLGIIVSIGQSGSINDPRKFFKVLIDNHARVNALNRFPNPNDPLHFNLPMYKLFHGIIGFDQQFEEKLTLDILKIIGKAIAIMADEVAEELKWRKNLAENPRSVSSRIILGKGTRMITTID